MKPVLSLLLLTCYLVTHAQHPYSYIGAPSGLNIRSSPSLDSSIVEKLPYGRWIRVIDTTDVVLMLRDEGELTSGKWIEVSFPSYLEDDPSEEIRGYVYGPFLTGEIDQIPPHTLYYIWSMVHTQRRGEYTSEYEYEITWQPPYSMSSRRYPDRFPAYFD